MIDTSVRKYYQAFLTSFLRKNVENPYSCFDLNEKFGNKMYYWYTRTENQYWLKFAMRFIVASGLEYKWNEWYQWKMMLVNKFHSQSTPALSDLVDIGKVLALLCCWGFSLVISLGIFCREIGLHISFGIGI